MCFYTSAHQYTCTYTYLHTVGSGKTSENPWTKTKELLNKYSLNTHMTPKATELAYCLSAT